MHQARVLSKPVTRPLVITQPITSRARLAASCSAMIAAVQDGSHVIDTRPGRVRLPRAGGWTVVALVVIAAAVATAGLVTAATAGSAGGTASGVRTRQPSPVTTVLTGPPATVSARAAQLLLAFAPAVVVTAADAGDTQISAAAAVAQRADVPLLLAPGAGAGAAGQAAALKAAIKALRPRAILALGSTARTLSADLPGVRIVTRAAALPDGGSAADRNATPLRHVAVLVRQRMSGGGFALAAAAAATARVAGARVISLPGYDPGTDPAAIRQLAAARPQRVVGIGTGFGSARLLAARVAVAETGVQLPGGGQVLFPMRRIVALYGTPGAPALGALGQQSLSASIARARKVAAQYASLTRVPVIPAFEIIATVAQASPGKNGLYSYETSVRTLRPWVRAATRAGMFVTLDLQPGRASLLTQAKRYTSLLRLPNVGLALDPEWKLGPGQLPLRQIGSVGIAQVNSVVTWLARLTSRYRLPQKLLELHEFRLTMITGIQRLDTRHRDLAIVINMDGQGAPRTKDQTWQSVVANAPRHVFFGWKDFYVKDTPMMDPRETIRHQPRPVLISYQ